MKRWPFGYALRRDKKQGAHQEDDACGVPPKRTAGCGEHHRPKCHNERSHRGQMQRETPRGEEVDEKNEERTEESCQVALDPSLSVLIGRAILASGADAANMIPQPNHRHEKHRGRWWVAVVKVSILPGQLVRRRGRSGVSFGIEKLRKSTVEFQRSLGHKNFREQHSVARIGSILVDWGGTKDTRAEKKDKASDNPLEAASCAEFSCWNPVIRHRKNVLPRSPAGNGKALRIPSQD